MGGERSFRRIDGVEMSLLHVFNWVQFGIHGPVFLVGRIVGKGV